MSKLPDRVVALLNDRTYSEYRPAYLLLDNSGLVHDTGGLTGTYGLGTLGRGDNAMDLLPVLESFLPVRSDGEVLHAVTTPSGVVVDLWAASEHDRTWVVLLDVSHQVMQQAHFQQQANEARLLAYRDDATATELRTLPSVLAALGVVVFARRPDGSFGVVGGSPGWVAELWPSEATSFRPQEHSPFLEHFLTEADECWRGVGGGLRRSGLWTEVDGTGVERHLTAWAVRSEQPLLVISDATQSYREQSSVMQQAREQALVHSRLLKEIEKKDVLLHSIVHDLRSPMISVHSTLQLLEADAISERSQQLVAASRSQLERQDHLIKSILDVFAADARGLEPTAHHGPVDLLASARETIETFNPAFMLKRAELGLTVEGDATAPWLVPGDRMRLVRVYANLIENALRYSRRGQIVRIRLSVDGDDYLTEVEDQGPGVPSELASQVFDRFARAGGRAGTAGLGLHFCRIMIEGWGGTIGQYNREDGGSCFWFKLPRTEASETET